MTLTKFRGIPRALPVATTMEEIEESNRCTLNEPRPSNPEFRLPPRIYRGSRERGFFDSCANARLSVKSSSRILEKKTNRRDRWIYIKFERQFPEPKNDRNRHVTISKLLRSSCKSLLFAVFQLISTNDDNCMTFFLSIFLYSFDRWTCNICCCSIRYEIRRKYF